MSDTRTFRVYKILTQTLARNQLKNPGITATLLLECFVCNDGQLRAGLVVERGLCEEGKFSEWRKELISKGWLIYVDGEYARHKPGAKLVKYLNKEKLSRGVVVNTEELFSVKKEFEKKHMQTEHELEKAKKDILELKESVRKLIEKHDPPVTEAKLSEYIPGKSSAPKKTTTKAKPTKEDEELIPFH